jgi:hypothetical protein
VSISIPLRHGTMLVALTLAMGVPFFQLDEKLSHIEESFELPSWIWPLVAAPVLLLLLNRLHEIAVELMDRAFNRHFHAARRQIEKANAAIAHAETLVEIDSLLIETMVRALCLSSGAVFRNEAGVFRRTRETKGWNASMKKELHPESDGIALGSLEIGAPVRVDQSDWDPHGLPGGLEAPCLSVPVQSGIPEATAVALFGPHETGNDINVDEREMMDRFALRAAAVYERVITSLLRQEVAQLKAQLALLQGGDRAERAGKLDLV